MANLKEEATKYEPKKVRMISDLPSVSIDLQIQEENEVEHPYKYVMVDGERYKVPVSVISALHDILEENKNMNRFKVKKTGENLNTKYTVIPLN